MLSTQRCFHEDFSNGDTDRAKVQPRRWHKMIHSSSLSASAFHCHDTCMHRQTDRQTEKRQFLKKKNRQAATCYQCISCVKLWKAQPRTDPFPASCSTTAPHHSASRCTSVSTTWLLNTWSNSVN